MADKHRFETEAIRIQAERGPYREHAVPIYATSSYVFDSVQAGVDAFEGASGQPIYSRFDNPNTDEFANKLARLEGMDAGFATASGMSAIFMSLMALLQRGDHVVGSPSVFSSTLKLLNHFLPRWGIETTLAPLSDPAAWRAAVRPTTRMFVLETPSNPGLELADLPALAEIAKEHGILVNVDNCFATPWLQRPAELGADIVTHSATKFIDGQGRVLGGAVLVGKELVPELMPFYRSTGPTLSAFNAWVLSKGLETLAVRMERHCDNAETVAQFLDSHPGVSRVRYPFLDSHPQHDLARRQMRRGGAMVTFDAGGMDAATRLVDRLQIFSCSANLGDTRSIVTHPATTTHSGLSEEMRERVGITPGLVRLSVGLEHPDDLIADLTQALG